MGGGGFSGNGSVEWDVRGGNVRRHLSQSLEERGFQCIAIDETPAEGVQFFTITIKLPKSLDERADFLDRLTFTESAKQAAVASGSITIKLPIEDQEHGGPTEDQVRVDWPSRETGSAGYDSKK